MVKQLACAVCKRSERVATSILLPVGKKFYCYECYAENGRSLKDPCASCGWELVTHVTANGTAYCQKCKNHYMLCRECGKPTPAVVYFFSSVALCVECSKNYTHKTFREKYGSIYGSVGQEIQFMPGGENRSCWIAEGTKD